MNRWQSDVTADARIVPGDAWDRTYWASVHERAAAFERAAQRTAEVFDIQTLENLFFTSIYATHGQANFDDYPLYRRALAIAREREAREAA